MIETITADSDNKDDNYHLLCLLHNAILQEITTSKKWHIGSTYTYVDEGKVMTTVSNGAIDIKAVSDNGHHIYTLSPTNKED